MASMQMQTQIAYDPVNDGLYSDVDITIIHPP